MSSKDKKYGEYLKGKKVVLVGPSWHTKHTNQKDLIESYDIVIRINNGFIISEKKQIDIGRRTDVLYCSLGDYFFTKDILSRKKIENSNIKWIIGTGHHKSGFLKPVFSKIDKKIQKRMVSSSKFKNVVSKIGTKKKITSGMVTIFDLLEYEFIELYITGFTFYNIFFSEKRKKYYYKDYMENYLSKASNVYAAHDNKKEFYFFKNLCNEDKRIICDDILKKIMEEN